MDSYFPYCTTEWFKLQEGIRSIDISKNFKKVALYFIRPKENSVYAIHDTPGLKLLALLRLNLSCLNEHKFRHNFKGTINPMCSCGFEHMVWTKNKGSPPLAMQKITTLMNTAQKLRAMLLQLRQANNLTAFS